MPSWHGMYGLEIPKGITPVWGPCHRRHRHHRRRGPPLGLGSRPKSIRHHLPAGNNNAETPGLIPSVVPPTLGSKRPRNAGRAARRHHHADPPGLANLPKSIRRRNKAGDNPRATLEAAPYAAAPTPVNGKPQSAEHGPMHGRKWPETPFGPANNAARAPTDVACLKTRRPRGARGPNAWPGCNASAEAPPTCRTSGP